MPAGRQMDAGTYCVRPSSQFIARRNSGRHGHTGSNSMERASEASEISAKTENSNYETSWRGVSMPRGMSRKPGT